MRKLKRVERIVLALAAGLVLLWVVQFYGPSMAYLAYRWQGGITCVQDLRIALAPGWFPVFRQDDNDGTHLTFLRIRPWFPTGAYARTLDVLYRPKVNLPQARIEQRGQRKAMRWGDFWIVNGPSGRPTMAYALHGGTLRVFFVQPDDLDAIESLTTP